VRGAQLEQVCIHPAQKSPFTGAQTAKQNGLSRKKKKHQASEPARPPTPLQRFRSGTLAKCLNTGVTVIDRKAGMRDVDDGEFYSLLRHRVLDAWYPLFFGNKYCHGILIIQENWEWKPTRIFFAAR
jgi:hypothetical protein